MWKEPMFSECLIATTFPNSPESRISLICMKKLVYRSTWQTMIFRPRALAFSSMAMHSRGTGEMGFSRRMS